MYSIFSDNEEKRSLTGSNKPESETDSMAEYGEGDAGRFTEDGSFIGKWQYIKLFTVRSLKVV